MLDNLYKEMPSSRREQVAHILREAILFGKLKSGERIREAELSEKLKVSRGPIREAIRQLEQEGLLITYPYKETVVAEIHTDEVHQVFTPIRIILETHSLEKGMASISDEDIEVLEKIAIELLEAGRQNNLSGIVENNLLFHEYIVSMSKSKTLEHIWHSIFNRVRIHFYEFKKLSSEDLLKDAEEHMCIVDAIKARDTQKAVDLLRKHIK